MRAIFLSLLAALSFFVLIPCPAMAQEKDSQQEKLYVGKQLDTIRDNLKNMLRDKELTKVFAPGDKSVTAIHLTVTRRGERVREIQVYVTQENQTGKKLKRILRDPKDPDFQSLVKELKSSTG